MNVQGFLKTLKFIHLSLVTGLTLFLVIAFVQNKGFNADLKTDGALLYIVPITALLGYFGSQVLFKKMLSKVQQSDALGTKLSKYQTATLVKYMLIETPAFIALFVYFATGNALPLVIAACLLAYLFVQRPTKDKIIHSLPLNSEDKKALDAK